FDVLAYLVLHGRNPVGHSVSGGVIVEGQQIVVTVAARDAQRWPAHQHSWSGDVAGVDRVAQSDVAVSFGPHVAYGSETRFQSYPGILGPGERRTHDGNSEFLVPESGFVGEVRVRVDQAGQYGCVRQFDAYGVRGRFGFRGWAGADDFSVFDDESLIREHLAALHIERVPGVYDYSSGTLLGDDLLGDDLPRQQEHRYCKCCRTLPSFHRT